MSRPTRAETHSAPVTVRLTQAEKDRVAEAARVNRQTRSQFVRDAITNAAEECLEA